MTDNTNRERPDPGALLGVTELAARYNVQPNTITVWQRRHETFPAPIVEVGGRVKVWWAPDVDKWVENR